MKHGSRNRLMPQHAALFPDATLFAKIARACCRAGCLPRKELYEAWEVARRTRRRFRGGRVIDLACGHGLLAQLLLILDDTSPNALALDLQLPPSSARLAAVLREEWPRLAGRVEFVAADLASLALDSTDLIVSAHACGQLSDVILQRAVAARARLALLPCCHVLNDSDYGGLQGWLDGALAQDVLRAERLRHAGYRVYTQTIPPEITPKNRLLLAAPI